MIGSIALLCFGIIIAAHPLGNTDEKNESQQNIDVEQEEVEIQEEVTIGEVTNPDDIHVVVNKDRSLPEGYYPDDLVVPNIPFSFSDVVEKSHLRAEAAEAIERLFELADEDGIELYAVSGFRSYERQVEVFNYSAETNGQEEAETTSAHPGHSEHQTGLAMDVSSRSNNLELTEAFGETEEGRWLAENAHRAGFIIRYLEGEEDITGYSYEPWHIRYVGDIAEEIFQKGITLEEFMGFTTN